MRKQVDILISKNQVLKYYTLNIVIMYIKLNNNSVTLKKFLKNVAHPHAAQELLLYIPA